MVSDSHEHSESSDSGSVRLPIWLKLTCIVVAAALLFFLVSHYIKKDFDSAALENNVVKLPSTTYPIDLSTEWQEITIRIDCVVRVDENAVVAEWAYCNNSINLSDSFSWGFSQPNYVALSKIIDSNGRQYSVEVNEFGDPICASTNNHDESGWSKEIFGGRDLPVWAKFEVPEDAVEPLRLSLHGLNDVGRSDVGIKLLTIDEQFKRAYTPRATNWPNIFIQLTQVSRLDEDSIAVKWQYINKSKENRFLWGLNQPNYVARTQVYDYSTGKYYNVAREKQNDETSYLCTTTNKEDGSGWSRSIDAGGTLDAGATFKGVKGENIQILFHSAVPLFYNPDKAATQSPKTN